MRDKTTFNVDPNILKRTGYFRIFSTICNLLLMAVFIAGCSKDAVKDQSSAYTQSAAGISEILPGDLEDAVAINPIVAVTFKSEVNSSEVSASTITLLEGTTPVQGTLSISGKTATFTPVADLKQDTKYTGTVNSALKSGSLDDSKKNSRKEHSWSFKTGKHRRSNELSVV